jgi:ATP-binding cassette, subfamily B (MDR/TAP), member 1
MLKSLLAVTMSAQGLGQNTSFLGDQAAANSAAARIFSIVDRKPEIDSSSEEGERLPAVEGRIELEDVNFAYPSRPNAKVGFLVLGRGWRGPSAEDSVRAGVQEV